MNWNVGQAKQHLSEVIREAAREPQVIYNRNQPVAAVIAANELAEYSAWKAARVTKPRRNLADEFAELRQLLIDAGYEDGLDCGARTDRPNAMLQMLEEEYPESAPGSSA